MAEGREAAIAGAGIGGLAAALALARRGWRVRLYERAEALEEVGAGLQMSPNACHVLRALGVLEEVEAGAFAPEAAVIRDGKSGAARVVLPLGETAQARFGAPYLCVHRADLHKALLAAAEAAGVEINLGRTVVGYENAKEAARLLLAEGQAPPADLVIGADGVRSSLTGRMHAAAAAPRYTGYAAWRAVLPAAGIRMKSLPDEVVSWAGEGGHLVTYPLRGGTQINLVAVVERKEWTAEDWRQEGAVEEMRAAFARWHTPLTALLDAVEHAHVWGLFARAPLRGWREGRAALLGDAAHPMLPFMAQGAAMALEDAFVLAASLEGRDVAAGLVLYEKRRAARTAKVQRLSKANAKRFHGGAAGRFQLAVASRFQALPRAMAGQVYGVDVTR